MKTKEYEYLWRNKWLTSEAKTIDDMIDSLRAAADHLQAMKEAGIVLDEDGGTGDDYARLVTEDPVVAEKFDLEHMDWDEEEEDWEDEVVEG